MLVSPVQLSNALSPMLVTLSGMSVFLHPEISVLDAVVMIPLRPFQTPLKQIRLWELAHVIQIASIIQIIWAI